MKGKYFCNLYYYYRYFIIDNILDHLTTIEMLFSKLLMESNYNTN